jgi:excinuclease UvrABC ATPase subunit
VHCGDCDRPVVADSARTIAREAEAWALDTVVFVLAPVVLSSRLAWDEQAGHLLRAGYTRAWISGQAVALDAGPQAAQGHEAGRRRGGSRALVGPTSASDSSRRASRRSGAARAV